MKKKQDQDAQGVSELFKKLQASFAAPEKSTPSKKKKNADIWKRKNAKKKRLPARQKAL